MHKKKEWKFSHFTLPVSTPFLGSHPLTEPSSDKISASVAGLFTAAFDDQLEWLVVKGISNYAGDTESSSENNWSTFASITATSVVFNILNDPVVFKQWPHYQGTRTENLFLKEMLHVHHVQRHCT